jgi:hypothetical protein
VTRQRTQVHQRKNVFRSLVMIISIACLLGSGIALALLWLARNSSPGSWSLSLSSESCSWQTRGSLQRQTLSAGVRFRYTGAEQGAVTEFPGLAFHAGPDGRWLLDDRTVWPGTGGGLVSSRAVQRYETWLTELGHRSPREEGLKSLQPFGGLQTGSPSGSGFFRLISARGPHEPGGGRAQVRIALFPADGSVIDQTITLLCPPRPT